MAQAANTNCEICMRAVSLHYCTQCNQLFCDDCKVSHLRSKSSKNHVFTTGPNINTEKTEDRCTDHNKDFNKICEDCNQLICSVCVNKAHNKHDLVNIEDANKKVQTEISNNLESKVNNYHTSVKSIEKKTKTYKKGIEAAKKAIVEHGNLIKAMVDKKVAALTRAITEREKHEMQSFSKAIADCKEFLREATRLQRIYQDMTKQCDEVVLFQKMKNIKPDIANLKSVDITRSPLAIYNRKHVNYSDVENMFGKLTFQ